MNSPFFAVAVLLAFACAGGCAMFDRPAGNADLLKSATSAAPQAAAQGRRQNPTQAGPPPQGPAAAGYSERATDPAATSAGNVTSAPGKIAGGAAATDVRAMAATAADPQALADVLAELASMGALEPGAQQRLIDDLRATDPALWPGVVQTFRASLAYRRRAAERAKAAARPAADPPVEMAAAYEALTTAAPTESAPPPSTAVPPPATPSGAAAAAAAASPASPVQPASHQSPVTTTAARAPAVWQQQLAPAIAELEKQTREPPRDAEAIARHVWLRMCYLAVGRREDALKPIPGIAPAQQDYWSKQIFALATYLDSQRVGDPSRRAAEAVQHLTRAAASLAEQGPLMVRNLAFCSAVESYGVHKRIEQHEFTPGQELLIYAEVENFKSDETEQGFHTALQASYQVLDSQGQRVAHGDWPLTEEHCQNRRRDYFVRYFLTLPKNIYDGTYTLEVTIEDTLVRKIGQSSIEFTVKHKK